MDSHLSPYPAVNRYREYAAGCVDAVLPRPKDSPATWEEVVNDASEYASSNGLKDEPHFEGDVEKFRRTLGRVDRGRVRPARWLVATLEEEYGTFVEVVSGGFGTRKQGIRRAGKSGIRRTGEWKSKCVEGSVASANRTVNNARAILPMSSIAYKLLPAGNPDGGQS